MPSRIFKAGAARALLVKWSLIVLMAADGTSPAGEAGAHSRMLDYPETRRVAHVDTLHGMPAADPYRWLEEIDSPDTRRWIDAQNQLTAAVLSRIPAREKILGQLTALWGFDRYGIPDHWTPVRRGGRYFFTRKDSLRNQSVLCWTRTLEDAPVPLVDPNPLSEDGTVNLADYAISRDGNTVAYGLSASGSDWQEWRCRDVASGKDLKDHLRWVKFSAVSWTHDGLGFFYSRYEEPRAGMTYKETNYNQKLYYHRLGTPQAEDELIYERPDQKEWAFAGRVTEDGRYLVITVWKGTSRNNGVFYQDLGRGTGDVIELLKDFDAEYAFVANIGSVFVFVTNHDAPRSRVIAVDLEAPGRPNWRGIIPESSDALERVGFIDTKFVATYLHDAHSLVRIFDLNGRPIREVLLPEIGTVLAFDGRPDDREAFYYFTGFTSPGTIYRHDMETGESRAVWKPEVVFDPDAFVTRQVFYTSRDGTRVPMFLCHLKSLRPSVDTPTLLHGYGGFNIPKTPSFSTENIVWMEFGGLFAQACLRGGGEYGESWHDAGTKHRKQNVFDDFIAAAEWLIDTGYTSTSRLAIDGRSNGGLLVGACLVQRPDLFGACLATVGVLDMLRFHKFTIGWAWTSDYGSPDDPEEFKTLLSYSPYHNVRAGTVYPPTLILTGDHDDRVFPAHSYKFAAALQAAQAGPAPVLIRIDTKTGHGAGKPTEKVLEEIADKWAFLARALDMEVAP